MAGATPRTLTITIDYDSANTSLLKYTTDGLTNNSNDVAVNFTGTANDATEVTKIFTTFLSGSEFQKWYISSSMLKGKSNRKFDEVEAVLKTLNPPTKIAEFNEKAFKAIIEWIKTAGTIYGVALTANFNIRTIFTDAGINLLDTTTYQRRKYIGWNTTSQYADSIKAYMDVTNNKTEYEASDFLKKYIQMGDWGEQLSVWLEKFKVDSTSVDWAVERRHFNVNGNTIKDMFTSRGGNRTRKNKKPNYDSDE